MVRSWDRDARGARRTSHGRGSGYRGPPVGEPPRVLRHPRHSLRGPMWLWVRARAHRARSCVRWAVPPALAAGRSRVTVPSPRPGSAAGPPTAMSALARSPSEGPQAARSCPGPGVRDRCDLHGHGGRRRRSPLGPTSLSVRARAPRGGLVVQAVGPTGAATGRPRVTVPSPRPGSAAERPTSMSALASSPTGGSPSGGSPCGMSPAARPRPGPQVRQARLRARSSSHSSFAQEPPRARPPTPTVLARRFLRSRGRAPVVAPTPPIHPGGALLQAVLRPAPVP
jgi:hypothetical protein